MYCAYLFIVEGIIILGMNVIIPEYQVQYVEHKPDMSTIGLS